MNVQAPGSYPGSPSLQVRVQPGALELFLDTAQDKHAWTCENSNTTITTVRALHMQ